MIKSIKHFEENSISKFEKLENEFLKNPTDMASYVFGLTEELHKLGVIMIQESLELMNQMLRESGKRLQNWVVEKTVTKQLVTSLGMVEFSKTLFTHKETGEMTFLLDRILGLKEHERMTEDAEAKMLEEAVQSSYRRGGEEASLMSGVSKQTVKNKIHALEFPVNQDEVKEKKVVDYLYIDADEDHASLQFREKKGDLEVGENGWKNNCVITKLVYVYEGIEKESPKSKRHKLINPYYFSRVCEGEGNQKFWDEIYEYIDRHYDLDKIKKIYLNADGGTWIQSGKQRISGIVTVLDEFHMQKYILKMIRHMKDSRDDAKAEIYQVLRNGTKKDFEVLSEGLVECAQTEAEYRHIEEGKKYLLSNWMAAKIRVSNRKTVKGCSAEGHVSHVLSSRMSSRPMGWSRTGAGKMAELRAYYYNGGDMLELVRYQKRELPRAVGAENEVLSCEDIQKCERKQRSKVGKYLENMTHSISTEAKKYAWFNAHIWGL